ncbi:MAG: HPr family phosphocarrier protein [Burkholderiaceae bacterium]
MQSATVTVVNKLGLHARPSAKLTQVATRFQSEVWLTRKGRRINAKSIMGVMMLAASKGSELLLEVEGPDEAEASAALQELFASGFGEALE